MVQSECGAVNFRQGTLFDHLSQLTSKIREYLHPTEHSEHFSLFVLVSESSEAVRQS